MLPYLLGVELVARVDLKHDRARRTLLVQAAWGEPGADADVAQSLAGSLQQMAQWLGADQVEPASRGDLAGPLAVHLR